ncbi:NUDIX hydrolase [Zobellia uliginosa]|uniref:NUDIX hydrolase n=1 Tax=Zobellia uliginosa TaxID=143224 RepID=UPI001C07829A|nr:NUDIX domain-containing protein [Zobellia uliginosa]MBU2946073.1 NUDIX domain-containing protein [Zobellia uliginosa]
MDELIDILDADGNVTGKTAMKSEAHRYGWFHPTVHIWFYTVSGRILIQQRSRNKDVFPLLWDVSVAGHIGSGEDIETSAIREIQEEIGVTIKPEALEKIGVFKSIHKHSEQLLDCEYHHTFLCKLEVPFHTLQKQESEVENLALVPLLQFSQETWGLANLQKYVPHSTVYYKTIIKAIKSRLH